MSNRRLLCVHAHPDDESLWTGGLLARSVDLGFDVDLVTCTWTEGTVRHGELLAAAAALGLARPPIMLGYADHRVPESAPGSPRFCTTRFDYQVRGLVAQIRRLRPDVIVTYDAVGIYGHPDHVHAHRLVTAAAEAAALPLYRRHGAPWQVSSLYFATIPTWMVDDVAADVFADVPRRFLPGTPPEAIDLTLDVTPWNDRKAAAIESHVTEIDRSRTLTALVALEPERRARLLGVESYIRRDLVPGGCPLD